MSVAVVAALALAETLFRYVRAVVGTPDVFEDAREVWMPAAQAVLDGQALYVGMAADNKPPLFAFLNVLVGATGQYLVVFYLLVGVANAVVAVATYRWLSREGHDVAGALAALLFVAALPLVRGTIINVRSFALVFVFGALLTQGAVRRGVLLAVAGLFSQFAMFAAAVLVYEGVQQSDTGPWRWLARFVAAGLATAVLAYLPLYLIWGSESLVNGIQMSLLSAGSYAATNTAAANPWLETGAWVRELATDAINLLHILVPATAMGVLSLRQGLRTDVPGLAALLALSFLLTFGVKVIDYYWLMPLAFLAPLAALFVVRAVRLTDRAAAQS